MLARGHGAPGERLGLSRDVLGLLAALVPPSFVHRHVSASPKGIRTCRRDTMILTQLSWYADTAAIYYL